MLISTSYSVSGDSLGRYVNLGELFGQCLSITVVHANLHRWRAVIAFKLGVSYHGTSLKSVSSSALQLSVSNNLKAIIFLAMADVPNKSMAHLSKLESLDGNN